MGNTDVNTDCRPVSSRSLGSKSPSEASRNPAAAADATRCHPPANNTPLPGSFRGAQLARLLEVDFRVQGMRLKFEEDLRLPEIVAQTTKARIRKGA